MLSRFGLCTHTKRTFSRIQPFSTIQRHSSHGVEPPEASEERRLTGAVLRVRHSPGALQEALRYFWKHDVNLTHIESRPCKGRGKNAFDMYVDFEGNSQDPKIQALLNELKDHCDGVIVLGSKEVPWFPRQASNLDGFASRTLDAGAELQSDHPGFNDKEYRKRREKIVEIALNYKHGTTIPKINYAKEEVETWGIVYDKLVSLYPKYACKEFNEIFPLLEKHCGYSRNNIPQQEDISAFLKERTGFTLRPVAGLLSSRDFLNALAFRVFFSTQYIRHHTKPLYTPEPDICHELMGHAPMFADPDFADFSHEIGLASLGASDEEVKRLATCYWFSVEFGLCKENGQRKAYGAGLLSSFGELEYSCGTNEPEIRPWDPWKAAIQPYPITTYQPVYYLAESLQDAKLKMQDFADSMSRPFRAKFDFEFERIVVDRAVISGPPQPPKQHSNALS